MKKSVFGVLISVVLISNSSLVYAGFLDKLVDRVGESVANTVSDKIVGKASDSAGQATDTVLDGSGQPVEQQESQYQTQQPSNTSQAPSMGGLGGMFAAMQKPVSISDSYAFALGVRTEITNDGRTQLIKQSMSDSAFYMEPSNGHGIIMDFDNRSMIVLDNQRKTKTAMSTDLLKQFGNSGFANVGGSGSKAQSVPSISNTGQTKQILGYLAELWVYESGQSRGEVWVSSELSFDMINASKKLVKLFGDRASGNLSLDFSKTIGDIPQGYPLESVHFENGAEVSRSRVIEVVNNPQTIQLAGYQLQSMMGQ